MMNDDVLLMLYGALRATGWGGGPATLYLSAENAQRLADEGQAARSRQNAPVLIDTPRLRARNYDSECNPGCEYCEGYCALHGRTNCGCDLDTRHGENV